MDEERHHLPHIHVWYQGKEASFSLVDSEVLSGELPKGKVRVK
jgi:hypothetical protein